MRLSNLMNIRAIIFCATVAFTAISSTRSLALPPASGVKGDISRDDLHKICTERKENKVQQQLNDQKQTTSSSPMISDSLKGIDCDYILNNAAAKQQTDQDRTIDKQSNDSENTHQQDSNQEKTEHAMPNKPLPLVSLRNAVASSSQTSTVAGEGVDNHNLPNESRKKRSFLSTPLKVDAPSRTTMFQGLSTLPLDHTSTTNSKNIDPEELETLLKANNLVKYVMENMGVGESKDAKEKRYAGADSEEDDKSDLLTLARMNVLANLKKSLLLQRNTKTGETWIDEENQSDRLNKLTSTFRSLQTPSKRSSEFLPRQPVRRDTKQDDSDFESSLFSSLTSDGSGAASSDGGSFPGVSAPSKRGYSGWYSRPRGVYKRRRGTMSINNAMMAITDMLLAEQRERLQRNRESIRYHMLVQG